MFVSTNSGYISALAQLLLAAPIDGVVTHDQCSDAIGFDIKSRRYLIIAAIKVANEEAGAIFKSIRAIGYQRLKADETHTLYIEFRGRTRRMASRTRHFATNAINKANDMSDAARVKAYREDTLCGVIAALTYNRNLPAIPNTDAISAAPGVIADSVKMIRDHFTSVYG